MRSLLTLSLLLVSHRSSPASTSGTSSVSGAPPPQTSSGRGPGLAPARSSVPRGSSLPRALAMPAARAARGGLWQGVSNGHSASPGLIQPQQEGLGALPAHDASSSAG